MLCVVCSVNLRCLLGYNNKPENQKVNENNKEEIKKGSNGNWSQDTACGIDQIACCDICVNSHFTLILSSLYEYKRFSELVKG